MAVRFLDQVRPLLEANLGSFAYKIVEEKSYLGGLGASVDVDCGALTIRITHERMADFYLDVSTSRNPAKWHELVYLLPLAAGESLGDANRKVGHSMADLSDIVRRFALYFDQISNLLSPERLSATERLIKETKLSAMDPRLRKSIK